MLRPRRSLQELNGGPTAPGEVPRAGSSQVWIAAALVAAALAALAYKSPQFQEILATVRSGAEKPVERAPQPAPPKIAAQKPQAHPNAPPQAPSKPQPAAAYDDRARPLDFYFARWGVVETLSPIGWTSRVEIRANPRGGAIARVWITCPKGVCEGGEYPVNVVAHLQKKDMTAFLGIERRDTDRVWSLLLRPAPGRPDELERMEWYGPPGTNVRTQTLLGHVRRMQAVGASR